MCTNVQKQRFHFTFAIKYIKYGLILCVVPMIRALFVFDLHSLLSAFIQDAAILLVMLAIAAILWYRASFYITDSNIHIKYGLLFNQTIAIPYRAIAVTECVRSPLMRVFGGAKLTLFFKKSVVLKKYNLFLTKKAAEKFCTMLMPVKENTSVYEPSGAQKLIFAILSVNVITSTIFVITFVNKLEDVLGRRPMIFTPTGLEQIAAVVAPFMPAGLSLVASALFIIFTFSFLISFFLTAGFRVCRNGGVLITKSGIFTKLERRYLCSAISACEIKAGPLTRVFRQYPVFIHAGGFHSTNVPAFAFSKKEKNTLSRLLPELVWHAPKFSPPKERSFLQFLYKPAACFLLALALLLAATNIMPSAVFVLAVPAVLTVVSCIISIEGFGCEGISQAQNRSIIVRNTKFFSRRDFCILTNDFVLSTFAHPISIAQKRCDAKLFLPCGLKIVVRGLSIEKIQKFTILH